jgi:hypothetical protein
MIASSSMTTIAGTGIAGTGIKGGSIAERGGWRA